MRTFRVSTLVGESYRVQASNPNKARLLAAELYGAQYFTVYELFSAKQIVR
jgi:hypothetical protein